MLGSGGMRVTARRGRDPRERNSFRGTEFVRFRDDPLPSKLDEAVERLHAWLSKVQAGMSQEQIARHDQEERDAVSAAVAAATAKEPDWIVVMLYRHSHERLELQTFAHETRSYGDGGGDGQAHSMGMTHALERALDGFRYASRIMTDKVNSPGVNVSVAFWAPQPAIVEHRLGVIDKLRTISWADDSGFALTN